MFDNPGQKLKKLAKFVFWLLAILNVIVILVIGALPSENGMKLGVTGILLLLVWLVIGTVIAWLVSVSVYAFGELTDDNHAMRMMIARYVNSQPGSREQRVGGQGNDL